MVCKSCSAQKLFADWPWGGVVHINIYFIMGLSSRIMYSTKFISFCYYFPFLPIFHPPSTLSFSLTSRRCAKAVPWNYHGIAMATVASRPSRVATAAWSIRVHHHGTSEPYDAWRESWRIVALYDVSWRYTHLLKLTAGTPKMEVLEDDFHFQRGDFQVLAVRFRGSYCWWKRGRNIEKTGDDAIGVLGGSFHFASSCRKPIIFFLWWKLQGSQ